MFNKHDIRRNACQLFGGQARKGYDWWWHSFTARHAETGVEKPFYVEFFLCNPAYGGEEPVFGQLEENKRNGKKPSYLMINVGTWGENARQFHRFFGWKKIRVDYGVPFEVEANDCFLNETETRGHIRLSVEEVAEHPEYLCDAGEVSWNLKITKDIAFNVGYGAGGLFRKMQLFEMFWHAEGMKSHFEGEIILDGERYIVTPETSYGYSDKNWGKDFTSPWLWLSSNHIISKKRGTKLENTVFDIGGGRPKIGPLALKGKLLSAIYYEGSCYEFNFSKFWTFTRTRFTGAETDEEIIWHVEQKTWRNKMVADFRCKKSDMLLINYESPDGMKRHNRLWNGGNGTGTLRLYHNGKLVDELICTNLGCEYGEYQ